jgi:hypothetical protein
MFSSAKAQEHEPFQRLGAAIRRRIAHGLRRARRSAQLVRRCRRARSVQLASRQRRSAMNVLVTYGSKRGGTEGIAAMAGYARTAVERRRAAHDLTIATARPHAPGRRA